MTAAIATKETVTPAKKRKPDLRVVPADDIATMGAAILAEAQHMRPAITRESIDREELGGKLAARRAERAELIEKKMMVRSLVETFEAAIDDEVADLDATIALYSGIGARLPHPSDD